MLSSVKQMLELFSPQERVRFIGVVFAMLAMGLLQMVGVGVVLPFVSLLSNPASVEQNAWLAWVYSLLGFSSVNGFLIFIGSILLFVLVASNAFTAVTLWLMTRFAWGVQNRISTRLLSGYLYQPYEAFLNRNSADIGKNILIESQQFANGVLMPALRAMAFGITVVMIVGFLVWLEPLLACAAVALFICAYLLVYLTVRRSLLRIGSQRMTANTQRFKAVSEAFGSVKEVKVMGRENAFLDRYRPSATVFATSMAQSQVLAQVPKFVVEGLAFGLVMASMLYLLSAGGGVQQALPVASAFVLAGYRLLPALQNVYQGFAQWRFNQSVIDALVKDLTAHKLSPAHEAAREDQSPEDRPARLQFDSSIELRDVSYWYPEAAKPSLKDVSIRIPKNSFVALTGATGAGKTTLADILLGLLDPTEGAMLVDERRVEGDSKGAWQLNLGYVPQEIYLTDNSIASNIAYGLDQRLIDYEAVRKAARIANIDQFIESNLPQAYETIVGERGVRLSGGQRQRIGIARALYYDPDVIVLDEATSALDNETERRIVDELDAMRGGRTLIVIAHRLTTVQKCHKVFMLEEGRLVAEGSYDEVIVGSCPLAT